MRGIRRFIDCYIDTETCNFRCHYCYIALQNKFDNRLFRLRHSPQKIAAALSRKRMGGRCLINLCAGGETLLSPDVLPVVKALLEEGHYVSVVTNGSMTKRFEEIRDTFSESERGHLFFKFSFHYLELQRLGLTEQYFKNIKMMSDAGCSFTCELTPSDEAVPYIEEIKDMCMRNLGALCHVTVARDDRTKGIDILSEMDKEEYRRVWGAFGSALFDFKMKLMGEKRKEFCYAGDWALYVNLSTGQYQPCNCGTVTGNIYIDDKIKFRAIGKCRLPYCYNGHAWLVLGAIPGFSNVTYADERDRTGKDGAHWLTDGFREVFQCKLEHVNVQYPLYKRIAICGREELLKIVQNIKRLTRKVVK